MTEEQRIPLTKSDMKKACDILKQIVVVQSELKVMRKAKKDLCESTKPAREYLREFVSNAKAGVKLQNGDAVNVIPMYSHRNITLQTFYEACTNIIGQEKTLLVKQELKRERELCKQASENTRIVKIIPTGTARKRKTLA